MITQITLRNFKSFREAVLPLGPLTVLVGANASGKSNVRDALRFLHGIGIGIGMSYSCPEILGGKYGDGGARVWRGIRGGRRRPPSPGARRSRSPSTLRSTARRIGTR